MSRNRAGTVTEETTQFTVVTGVVGDDSHVVGIRLIEQALEDAGFDIVSLGVQTPPEEFFEAAVETDADAILVSSMSGHAKALCKGFRAKTREYGLDDIVLYLGGTLSVGEVPEAELRELYTGPSYGFDRVYAKDTSTEELIEDLERDLFRR